MYTLEVSQQEYDNLKTQGLDKKYGYPGVYSISIKNKVVYVGKSRDMLSRIAYHVTAIKQDLDKKSNRYQVLRQAMNRELNIKFDVLYTSIEKEQKDIDDDIGRQEAILIRQLMPPLNYQLPLLEDYHKFEVNKKAKTITLDEILGVEIFKF